MPEELILAAHQPPFPTAHGALIRTHRLLTGLATSFRTTFVTFISDTGSGDGAMGREELERELTGIEVITVPHPAPHKRLAQATSLGHAGSWQFGRYRRSRAFSAALHGAVARARDPVVHLDDLGVALFGPCDASLTAFAPHNVEHRILQGTAQSTHGLRAAFAELEWRKVWREERRVWRQTPLCIAVSEIDAAAMRAGGAARVAICPNGVDPVARAPRPPRRRADEPLRVLFVGTVSYAPYERGVAWFIREVMPRVQVALPIRFDVVGSPPRHPAKAADVAYRGRVASVQEWYERAHVAVVPVFHGSGTRLKVLEAMAFGRPVVSTTLGAEGLPVVPEKHYLRADDAEGFATRLVTLGRMLEQDDNEVERLLAAAREAVTPFFWPRIVQGLAQLYSAH